MAVYYRYRSGVETFSLPVLGPSISVGELKLQIMATSRHGHGRTRGRGPREGVALSNAQTGEEYADDSALVLRNSTVVVRRVAGPPTETVVVASSPRLPKAAQDGHSPSDSARSGASAGPEDDEEKAISAVIDAAQLKFEDPPHGARFYSGRRVAAHDGARAPPAGYVCHRCRVPGHFIQHCPTNGDPSFDYGSRATTGTPALAPAPAAVTNPATINDIPEELHCKICKKVMADAVMTGKCCFNSFCDGCIRDHIAATCECVCGARVRADDLIPNRTLRTTIANILATRASSAASDKPRSSVGSNPLAVAASGESSRSNVSSKKAAASEQSDGSGSTSHSATAPAAPHTERKEETRDTSESRADVAGCHGYGDPFGPAWYDPFYGGGMPAAAVPGMYYGGMPYAYGGGYPMGPHFVGAAGNMPVPPPRCDGGAYSYHGERDSKRRKCNGSRTQVARVLV